MVELYECDRSILNDVKIIERVLIEAAEAANATIVNYCFHEFSPHGVSGVVVITESHIAIHTWPEHRYCAVDIFTCGNLIDNNKALEVLKKGLGSRELNVFQVQRGLQNKNPAALISDFKENI